MMQERPEQACGFPSKYKFAGSEEQKHEKSPGLCFVQPGCAAEGCKGSTGSRGQRAEGRGQKEKEKHTWRTALKRRRLVGVAGGCCVKAQKARRRDSSAASMFNLRASLVWPVVHEHFPTSNGPSMTLATLMLQRIPVLCTQNCTQNSTNYRLCAAITGKNGITNYANNMSRSRVLRKGGEYHRLVRSHHRLVRSRGHSGGTTSRRRCAGRDRGRPRGGRGFGTRRRHCAAERGEREGSRRKKTVQACGGGGGGGDAHGEERGGVSDSADRHRTGHDFSCEGNEVKW